MLKGSINNDEIYPNALDAYAEAIKTSQRLTHDEEKKLAARIEKGDQEALDMLVRSNLMYVLKVANEFKNYFRDSLELNDIVNEGNIGLLIAAKKYNKNSEARFLSYADFWIRKYIRNAISNHSLTIRIPDEKLQLLNKIKFEYSKQIQALEENDENKLTIEEVASSFDVDESLLNELINLSKMQYDIFQPVSSNSQSYDYDDEVIQVVDIIEDKNMTPTDHLLNDRDVKNNIETILSVLPERQKLVLCMIFGICGYKTSTLEEVATELGISKERVWRIKETALNKLKLNLYDKEYLGL